MACYQEAQNLFRVAFKLCLFVIYFVFLEGRIAAQDFSSQVVAVPISQGAQPLDSVRHAYFLVNYVGGVTLIEAQLLPYRPDEGALAWYGGILRVASRETEAITFQLVRVGVDGRSYVEKLQSVSGPYDKPLELLIDQISSSNDLIYRRLLAKEQLRSKYQSELTALRTDAEKVAEFAKLLDAQHELVSLKAELEDLGRDLSALEHFVGAVGGYPSSPLTRSRQQELTAVLGEIAEKVRSMERSEPARMREVERLNRQRAEELKSIKGLDPEILRRRLIELQRERRRIIAER